MPEPKFKPNQRVKCVCTPGCDITLVVKRITNINEEIFYEVCHESTVMGVVILKDNHYVTEGMLAPIEATA